MKNKIIAIVCVFLLTGFANASVLNGDSIATDTYILSPKSAIVGYGTEFTGSYFGTDRWTADFQDDLFTLGVSTTSSITGGSGFLWSFTGLDFSDGSYITDVQLISHLGTPFANTAGISFTDHSISINMGRLALGYTNGPSTWGKYKIFTSSSVPEPASLVLLGLGLVGIGFTRKIKAA